MNIKKTVVPSERPTYNQWVKELNVSRCYENSSYNDFLFNIKQNKNNVNIKKPNLFSFILNKINNYL